ncbi:MAG: hypothetical protein JWP50_1189 [Phenylobacterium sp.]|nr:hypothetical protein [Phenylobacterium sp.]
MAAAKAKYQHTATPLAVEVREGRTVVTPAVAGNFPGSPVDLAHAFRLKGGPIASWRSVDRPRASRRWSNRGDMRLSASARRKPIGGGLR